MREETQRQRRAASLVREIVSNIIRTEVHDDDIGFVTVTEVEMSIDLRNANVYFSILGSEEEAEQSMTALNRARKFINIELGKELEMRYTPELRFLRDQTPEKAQRIEELLDRVHEDLPDDSDGDDETDQ